MERTRVSLDCKMCKDAGWIEKREATGITGKRNKKGGGGVQTVFKATCIGENVLTGEFDEKAAQEALDKLSIKETEESIFAMAAGDSEGGAAEGGAAGAGNDGAATADAAGSS